MRLTGNQKNSKKKFKKFGIFFQFFLKRVLQKRILDTLKSFCYFWALDMAPTWAVPGLFLLEVDFWYYTPSNKIVSFYYKILSG